MLLQDVQWKQEESRDCSSRSAEAAVVGDVTLNDAADGGPRHHRQAGPGLRRFAEESLV